MKNLLKAVMAFAIIILAGCGGTGENVSGETYETEVMSVLVPKGWKAFPYYQAGSQVVIPGTVALRKGATDIKDQMTTPGLLIAITKRTNNITLSKSNFADGEDLEPFEYGKYTWTGIKGTFSLGSTVTPMMMVQTLHEGYNYRVDFILEMSGKKISMDDTDVKAIIESIIVK